MPVTTQRYHAVAMSLHWLIGLLIIVNLLMGLSFGYMDKAVRFEFMQLHKSFGITVLLLTVVRILWRFAKGAPAEPSTLKRWEVVVSGLVHFLLYGMMIMIPFSGWALVSSSSLGIPTVLYGIISWPHLPFFEGVPDLKAVHERIQTTHAWLAYSTLFLLFLHVGAGLKHHFMQRDEILFRMTPAFLEGLLRRVRGEKA
jgi:cytochrome b561